MGSLYTALKIFHYKDKIDSLPRECGAILPPVHIRIKPTNICGHNCKYCAYTADNLQLGKDMQTKDMIPKEKMLEIIEDISEIGVKAVTFSGGGDPFYYPHLLTAVKKLSQTKIKFASLTNGARLQGELAEIFAHSATWLRISIDGWDDESYSQYRGVPVGEWSKVMKNLENFKKLNGRCFLGISLIVDRENSAHVYEMIELLKNTGVDSVKVSACIMSDDVVKSNKYHEPVYDEVKSQIQRAIETLKETSFEIFDSYHHIEERFTKNYTWCPYLQILPIIGADLNIYSCQDKAYNLAEGLIGSIRDQRLKEFWFSGKSKFFRINPSVTCNHHCIANQKNKMILDYLHAEKDHMDFV